MIFGLYITVLVLTAGATHAFAVRQQAIPLMSMSATAGWALLAIQGGSITIHRDGVTYTASEPAFQYFAAGLSALSFMALVLWYWGAFPDDDSDELPDGEPITEGI